MGLSDFTLTLHAPGYPCPVQILAAAPAPLGKPTYPDAAYAPITCVNSLASPTDIGPAYAQRHGTPEPGSQIALKLIPLSPTSVRGQPLILTLTAPLA